MKRKIKKLKKGQNKTLNELLKTFPSVPQYGDYVDRSIPKKSGGVRKICIPSKSLLNYQRIVLLILEKRLSKILHDNDLENVVTGFVPFRSPVTAAKQHIGYVCTVITDIENFFDNCTIDKDIPKELFKEFPRCFHLNGYAGQGFATSPMIANLTIIPCLVSLRERLKTLLKDFAFTIYADDIQVSFNLDHEGSDDYVKQNAVVRIIENTISEYGFSIKKSKTRIRYAKYGFRRILGINVGDTDIQPSRKIKRKLRCAKHQGNYPSIGGLSNYMKLREPLTKEEKVQRRIDRAEKNLEKSKNIADGVPW